MEHISQDKDSCLLTPAETSKKRANSSHISERADPWKKPKLPHNETSTKACNTDNNICVGTEAAGLNIFSKEGQQYIQDLNRELCLLNEQAEVHSSSVKLPESGIESSNVTFTNENIFNTSPKGEYNLKPKKKHSPKRHNVSSPKDEVIPKRKCSPEKPKPEISLPPEILSNIEPEIDEVLEEKAWKNNLSTINVKNILRHVITNEHVLSMVRNTMREDKCSQDKQSAEDAIFEPKLTRSKAKELIQKQENVPWPISPIKKSQVVSCKFSERLFSDEESSSDEEYDPTHESEDEDGRLSPRSSPSPASDGDTDSTRVSSPSTPIAEQGSLDENLAEKTLSCPKSTSMMLDLSQQLSDDTIALRTRSKLPLTDTPLESIEASLVAPDITTDMYDSECDDEDWKNFLQEFVHPTPSTNLNDTADDDIEDPEYNFLEEEEELDTEDLRDDRAVKISKKEITELMAELFEAADTELADCDDDDDDSELPIRTPADQAIETAKMALTAVSAADENCIQIRSEAYFLFSEEQRHLLEEQMRKHVQLLTQGYILSCGVPDLKAFAETYKALLIELQAIAIMRAISSQHKSLFNAYNLIDAIQLVTTYKDIPDDDIPKRKQRKKSQVASGFGISCKAMEVFSNNTTFIYPELLPDCGFSVLHGKKLGFSEAEDVLLSMGLYQFGPLMREFYVPKLIREHMLPCKTELQIRTRIKHLRSQKSGDNPVKFLLQQKILPQFAPQLTTKFDPNAVKKPVEHPSHLLPKWLVTRIHSILGQHGHPLPIRPTQPMYLLTPVPTTTQSFITGPAPTTDRKALTQSLLQFQPTLQSRMGSSHVHNAKTTAISSTVGSIIYVPSSMPNQVATVSVLNLQSATCSGPLLTDIKTVLNTHEKTVSPAISGGIPLSVSPTMPKRVSPLKQVSPILKKYSPKRMRKTGGNLTHAPLILPKLPRAIYLSPLKKGSRRPLAPKPSSIVCDESVQQALDAFPDNSTEICQANQVKTEDIEGVEDVTHCTKLLQEQSADSQAHDDAVAAHEQELLSPPIIEMDSQSDTELFEDEEEPVDSAEDLAALMAASTTIQTTPRGRQQHLIARKSTRQKDMESTLQLLAPDLLESDPLKEDRETAFAQSFLLKVKEATKCKPNLYEEFLKLLYEFGQSDKPVNQLHRDVCKVLKGYPELCDDFVAFLLPEQAMECGKLMEYLEVNKMRLFLRKVEVHFTKHPQHVQKLIKALAQCQQQTDLDICHIKSVMQPLFRGQAHLMEEFLHLFPSEKTPNSYMTDFEEIVLPDSDVETDEDGYERITLPDEENDYGGKKCKCSCHNTQGPKFLNRVRHCASCGIKIINGRIYIQTGKALKPAQVTYLNPEDKQYVLQQQKSLVQSSPKSIPLLSPTTNESPSETDPVVTHIDPHSPSSQCSESSSVSSLSPTAVKDVDDEKEGNNEPQVKSNSNLPTHLLLETLEHLSQDATTTNLLLPSDAVIDDAILTPDTSKASALLPQDFSVLRLVLGKQKPQVEPYLSSHKLSYESNDSSDQNEVGKNKNSKETIPENVIQETNHNSCSNQLCSVLPNVMLPTTNIPAVRTAAFITSFHQRRSQADYQRSSQCRVSSQHPCSKSSDKALTGFAAKFPVVDPLDSTIWSSPTTDGKVSDCAANLTPSIETDYIPTVNQRSQCGDLLAPLKCTTSICSPVDETSKGSPCSSTADTGLSAKNHSVDEHGEVVVLWTRDADRLILQTCQNMGANREVFENLSKQLGNKSVNEVSQRFSELISLFSEHQCGSSDSDTSDTDGR